MTGPVTPGSFAAFLADWRARRRAEIAAIQGLQQRPAQ